MGDHLVASNVDQENRTNFIHNLLCDIKALEIMLEQGMIEDDIQRIGAEQELCLINENWRPSKNAGKILEDINNKHFATELAKYNLEINLDPLELKGNCFTKMESKLKKFLAKTREEATYYDDLVLLTGILPTISKDELEMEYMTPNPRYWVLNNMMKTIRGEDFELKLKGVDELTINHDSVLFEACNTSFQMHLQVAPDDFISSYNWAQAIAGPILGISTNSPLLLGRELWAETRIALFQQSIDTRSSSYALKNQQARVTFGDSWARGSIVDIFRHEIARYKVILSKVVDTNSLADLKEGNTPKLKALNLHNGTIYRWNRPCYGTGGGKAHVRIENRYIPAGPTTLDEMANFAFWVGTMVGRPEKYDQMWKIMDFRDAKANFIKAARTGKESVLVWDGELISCRDVVINRLLPIAEEGLKKVGIDQADIHRYLDVIEARAKGQTGSQWMVRNYRNLIKTMKEDDALLSITKAIYENQWENTPVHNWEDIKESETHKSASVISHIMSTQLFSVTDTDLAELATSIMKWTGIHHIPVEDKKGNLVGILTWTHMKNFQENEEADENMIVSDIMVKEVHTADPETKISSAIALMKEHEIGCLPVTDGQQLVGIVTIKDVIEFDQ